MQEFPQNEHPFCLERPSAFSWSRLMYLLALHNILLPCAGFGSRMLAKMGYEGQGSGLGRKQQGRAEPITATMRPKQLGLGAS